MTARPEGCESVFFLEAAFKLNISYLILNE